MSSSNNRHRSSSLGAVPHKKQLARSRAQSSAASPLEVRCACQFFQCESLIPERVNPIGTNVGSSTSTRPQSRAGGNSSQHIIEEEEAMMNNNGSVLSFGRTSVPDYYGETSTSPIRSPERPPAQQHPQYHQPQQNLQYSRQQTPQPTSDFNHPLSSPQRDWRYSNKENSLPPTTRNQPLSFEGRNIPSIEVETFSLSTFTQAEASDRLKIDHVYSSREFGDELAQIENENGAVTGYSAFDKAGIVENENNGFRGRSMDRRSIAIGPVGVEGISRDAREMSQPVTVTTMITNQFSSQKSLDRYSNSVLLNRYRQKSQSRSNSVAPSMTDVRFPPRMVKTVSFDYGKPTTMNGGSVNNNGGNANPNFDQYHRMSPMVFHVRERLQKIDQIHSHKQNQQQVEVG